MTTVSAIYIDKFRTWVACYDVEEDFSEVFRQIDWELDLDSGTIADPNADQRATTDPTNGIGIEAKDPPETDFPLLNSLIIDPNNSVQTELAGTVNVTRRQ